MLNHPLHHTDSEGAVWSENVDCMPQVGCLHSKPYMALSDAHPVSVHVDLQQLPDAGLIMASRIQPLQRYDNLSAFTE
jgi:hypothetical protein